MLILEKYKNFYMLTLATLSIGGTIWVTILLLF